MTIDFASAVKGTSLQLQRGDEQVTVRVPPGANEGSRLRIPGQGGQGFGGGPPGDLLLTVHVTPHPHFQREGDDLTSTCPSPSARPTAGEDPRPDARRRGDAQGAPAHPERHVTRLRGKGVTRKGEGAGDLYVKFFVHVPTGDEPEVAKAIDALAPG